MSEKNRGRLLFWLLVAFIAFTFYAINQNRQRAMEGQDAKAALCVLRSSQVRQLHTNETYLIRKGDPIVIFGIKVPRATIANSVASQRRTVQALNSLNCKEEP